MVRSMLQRIIEVLERQYKGFIAPETDALRIPTAGARLHNIDAEEVMGTFSSLTNARSGAIYGFQSLPGRNEAPSRHHLSREPSSCAFPPVYTFVTYYDSFVTYLAQKCPVQNDLRVKLLEDMKTPHSKTELQALGIVGRLVFASWMSTINTNQPDFSYMEGVDLIISIIDRMKTLLASDVRFEKDMFENVLNKKDMPN
ncbi:hypothetical protein CAPTEDRAFT_208348 [Capitella teleta]|uniref:Uncharacterized protein n=1 Tax=Capitella teleta TaxID=283909 RepID=R7UU66_CAPTE|nr:hypothetical protein CAPTEDRAFT_208348 [Capitella teleta]|eukprot:ELU09693.1 hypothetical protein CAPTEDRAFT_208348 [Capitella teleta]